MTPAYKESMIMKESNTEAKEGRSLLRGRRSSTNLSVKSGIKAGDSRFRSRDKKYKEKSGCVTMTIYSSNGGDD